MDVIPQKINLASSSGVSDESGRRMIKVVPSRVCTAVEWILRISLGLMYLYSSIDLMIHPKSWTWAVPWWFSKLVTPFVPLDVYLRFQGGVELIMAIVFLALFWKGRFVLLFAVLSSLELLFILFFSPQFATTFRDIGVLGASVALCLLLWERMIVNQDTK